MAFKNRYRFVIAFLIFCSTASIYIGRINMSIAIVEMSEPHKANKSHRILTDACPAQTISSNNEQSMIEDTPTKYVAEKFNWNERTQGIILGSFFWGYVLFQIPSGRMAEMYGPRLLITIGIFGTGVINLITPLLVHLYYVFIASRVVLGLLQATVLPSCYALASHWIPDQERSAVISLIIIGAAIGTIVTSTLSGYLAKHGFAGGWPSIFYVSGIIGIIISIIYFIFVTNKPRDSPFVSQEEYEYISNNIAGLKVKNDQDNKDVDKNDKRKQAKKSFPWIKVLTSRAVMSEIAVRISTNWVYSLILLKAPAYMKNVLSVPLEVNGYYSAVMSFTSVISHFFCGLLADYFIKKKLFGSKTTIRKLFEGVCVLGSAIFICLIPSAGCSQLLFLLYMVGCQIAYGFEAGGELPLPSDLSNEYSATLFAIANMFGMATAFVGPYLTGIILDMDPSKPKQQWAYIIYFTGAFNVLGGIIFTIFGTAEPQNFGQHDSYKTITDPKIHGN